MTSKAIKGYKFVFGGKGRPGIVGVKPKSGGVIDEFKSKRLKELGKTQRKLKSQDKQVGEAIKGAQKKGLSRKDAVKGRKFQRDIKRAKREGDKLRKDVLRVGKKEGGKVSPDEMKRRPGPRSSSPRRPRRGLDPQKPAPKLREQIEKARPKSKPGTPVDRGGKLKKPKPGSYDYQLQETMKPGYRKDRKEMKKGGKALKPVDKQKNPGLAKLPTHVRNKMGYMKDGGSVNGKMTKEKFLDKAGASEKEKDFFLRGKGGDISDYFKKKKKKFGGGKK